MRLIIVTALFSLQACALVSPTCRTVEGPAELNVQGGMSGGSVLAKVERGGVWRSYPCPTP